MTTDYDQTVPNAPVFQSTASNLKRSNKSKLFILPFLYFYVLSFSLIAALSYMLVRNPMQADSTFAHSGNNFDTDIIIDLSVSDSDESEEVLGIAVSEESPNNATSACRNTIAAKIDKFFGKYKVPLTGFGCDFDLHGQESKVDPLMIASIAWCESTGGKVTPQFQGKESYNAWGWAVYDSNETTKSVNGYSCDSWDHCIGRVTRGIARNSEKRNLTSLPEHVVTWYNPGSVQRAGGEPTESSWYKCVSGTIDKMNAL